MTSIEVPYDDYTETQYDVRPEAETASDTSQDSDAMRIAERLRAGRQEGSDTHLNYIAQDPGLALYRHEELQLVLDAANRTELVQDRRIANQRVMEKLANLGVSVFLISYECDDVWKEVKHCIFEASNMQLYNCSPDRCLLYEDSRGRLFNLLVGGDFQGLQGSYEAMLDRASGLEAICALVVLIRAFACVGKCTSMRVCIIYICNYATICIVAYNQCVSHAPTLSFSINRTTRRHSSRLYCSHFRFGSHRGNFEFMGQRQYARMGYAEYLCLYFVTTRFRRLAQTSPIIDSQYFSSVGGW
jgi:hypothetical protein